MNYYISDLHLGHSNIIGLCNRPFNSVEEMDKALIDNWNSVVTDKDDVYILGDFCFRSATDPVSYLKQLKGKKHLIIGNHDSKMLKNKQARDMFVSIDYYKEIREDNNKIVMFHYPIAEWDGFFHNAIHLYGHIHNSDNETNRNMAKIPNAYNIGADVLDFTPKTLKQIIGK